MPLADGALSSDAVRVSLADVTRRVASVVPTLRDVLTIPFSASASSATSFAVTGVGGSEGPARLLVAALASSGRLARFVPISAFVEGTVAPRGREALCIFSQGLSPNARVAIDGAAAFDEAFLFTSLAPTAPCLLELVANGGHVVSLPPSEEAGTLLRLVGPAVAMLAAALFARGEQNEAPNVEVSRTCDALARTAASARSLVREIERSRLSSALAFVTTGENESLANGLAIKWIEGLARPAPPTWDALEVAHGPFHAFYTEPMLLVALGPRSPIFERLESILVPSRHTLVHFETTLPFPYARLEVEVAVNELFLAAFEACPRDLFAWPSKGKDEPLYGIAESLAGTG